jgi:hypothetical protein
MRTVAFGLKPILADAVRSRAPGALHWAQPEYLDFIRDQRHADFLLELLQPKLKLREASAPQSPLAAEAPAPDRRRFPKPVRFDVALRTAR